MVSDVEKTNALCYVYLFIVVSDIQQTHIFSDIELSHVVSDVEESHVVSDLDSPK